MIPTFDDAVRLHQQGQQGEKGVYWNNYGAALHALGRYVEALACFHHALSINPKYADALANLGMAQESLGQDGPAQESLRRTLELDPRHADALNRLAGVLQKVGRFDEAAKTLAAALAPEKGTGPICQNGPSGAAHKLDPSPFGRSCQSIR